MNSVASVVVPPAASMSIQGLLVSSARSQSPAVILCRPLSSSASISHGSWRLVRSTAERLRIPSLGNGRNFADGLAISGGVSGANRLPLVPRFRRRGLSSAETATLTDGFWKKLLAKDGEDKAWALSAAAAELGTGAPLQILSADEGGAMQQAYKLNTGAVMPAVALGLAPFGLSSEQIKAYALLALEIGYRSVDTAQMYRSHVPCGEALKDAFAAGIAKREEIFVTTKIWCDDMHPPDIIPALRKSLSELQLDYVDLCLLHVPIRIRKGSDPRHLKDGDILPLDLVGCWQALEQGVELGLAKAIGVSNFSTMRLKEIAPHAKIFPAVNQIELHPGCDQPKLREYCKQVGIHVCAWSPLGAPGYGTHFGSNAVFDSPIMKDIAEKHGKTIGQIALRWCLDKGVGLGVKSSNRERLAQNLDVFGFTLSPEDHEKIMAVPHFRLFDGSEFFSIANSPYKSSADIWDDL